VYYGENVGGERRSIKLEYWVDSLDRRTDSV
jgi:hypothetical protein